MEQDIRQYRDVSCSRGLSWLAPLHLTPSSWHNLSSPLPPSHSEFLYILVNKQKSYKLAANQLPPKLADFSLRGLSLGAIGLPHISSITESATRIPSA